VYGPLSIHAKGEVGNYQPFGCWLNVKTKRWEALPLSMVSCRPQFPIPLEALIQLQPNTPAINRLKRKYGGTIPIFGRSWDYLKLPKLQKPTPRARLGASSSSQQRPVLLHQPSRPLPSLQNRSVNHANATPKDTLGLWDHDADVEVSKKPTNAKGKGRASEVPAASNDDDTTAAVSDPLGQDNNNRKPKNMEGGASIQDAMTDALREGVKLTAVRVVKQGKASGEELHGGNMLRQYAMELATKYNRPVEFFLKLAGLILSEERALSLWQLWLKVVALRADVPTGGMDRLFFSLP
jgi:hypothetical protein